MKWYTREWQRGDLEDAESDRRGPDYAAYVASIADRLPTHVVALALPRHEHQSVDDAFVDLAEFDETTGRVHLRLVNGSLQTGYGAFDIRLVGVTSIVPPADELEPMLANPSTEFLAQEVHALDDGLIEVGFLLWPEGEFAIRCADVRTAWTPVASRDDHRNEVLIRRPPSPDVRR